MTHADRLLRPIHVGLAALLMLIAMAGCGSGDLVFPGNVPATATVGTPGVATATPGGAATPTVPPAPTFTPTPLGTGDCLPSGDDCSIDDDCCSHRCTSSDGFNFSCQ